MVFGNYEEYHSEISAFPLQLNEEIKEKGYVLSFFSRFIDPTPLADRTPTDLLRIFGRINIDRIDSILNKNFIYSLLNKKTIDEYKRVDNEFNKIYKKHFPSLVERYDASPHHLQIFSSMKQYLSYQPFPFEQAKCLRLYKVRVEEQVEEQVKRKRALTPYEFAKELRKSYLDRIEGIYKIFGGASWGLKLKLPQMLHGELVEIKCLPFSSQDSWKATIKAWSRDQNWGAYVPEIEKSISQFLDTYVFSHLLEISEQEPSAKEKAGVVKRKFFVFDITEFPKTLSFKAYVVQKTIWEFFEYLFVYPSPQDLTEIKGAFSEEMQNEKRRNTFIYFFRETAENYANLIRSINYTLYQKALKAQFKNLKHLIFKYNKNAETGKKYILSKKKEKFYDLLLSYLMAIHVFGVFPKISLNDRRSIFRGIWRMESPEKLALYQFLCCQEKQVTHGFSKLSFRHHRDHDLKEINGFLRKCSFSIAEEARIKIQFLFFHRGLMFKDAKAEAQGFKPINFAFCLKLVLNIEDICGFQLPANAVSYILTWNYLNKKGIEEIRHLKDRLGEAKVQTRELILKDKGLFFISPQSRQYIHEAISRVTPKSTFIPKDEAIEALYNCLRYTIYPHIAPSYFYPFIFEAFELSDARFNRLKDWGNIHLRMFRKLEPYSSALRVDTCWKVIEGEEYFQLHLTYFPSSHEPQSFHIEETLKISRGRLRRDTRLCQILRVFSIFLADEFAPIRTVVLESGEQRKHEDKGKGKQKADEFRPIETGEQRKHEDKDKGKQKVDEAIEAGDLKSGGQRQFKEKKGKEKIKLDESEPESESEFPESPQSPRFIQFPEFTGNESYLEEALSRFDNPIFSQLWNNYEADDKNEVSEAIYDFFFRIKTSIRKKMDEIFFWQQRFPAEDSKEGEISLRPHPEDIIKIALEGTIYSDAYHISLIPLNFLNDFPQYGVKKQDYFTQMLTILRGIQDLLDFKWENFFIIEVGEEHPFAVNVEYKHSQVAHCDYYEQHTLELQSLLQETADIEKNSRPERGVSISSSGEAFDHIQTKDQTEKHLIIFSFEVKDELSFSFSMAYQREPSFDMLYWQIVMLKWKFFKFCEGR